MPARRARIVTVLLYIDKKEHERDSGLKCYATGISSERYIVFKEQDK